MDKEILNIIVTGSTGLHGGIIGGGASVFATKIQIDNQKTALKEEEIESRKRAEQLI